MTEQQSQRKQRRTRRSRAAALVAVLVALLISAMPGTASAAYPQVVPLINCYYPHTDGSITVVLGYRSTYTTNKTIPKGSSNYTNPSSFAATLPTVFKPGTQNGVASLRIQASQLTPTTSWYLDGTTLNYMSASYGVPVCTQAQLPAFANGAAIALAVLLAGITGVVVMRRGRRKLLRGAPAGSVDA